MNTFTRGEKLGMAFVVVLIVAAIGTVVADQSYYSTFSADCERRGGITVRVPERRLACVSEVGK